MKRLIRFIAAVALIFNTSCNGNIFNGIANPDGSQDDILEEMQINVDNSDWAAAILNYSTMSAAEQQNRSALFLYASALAGQCGFSFLPFLEALQTAATNNTIGNGAAQTPLFLWLLQNFKTTTINMQMSSTAPVSAAVPSDNYCAAASQALYQIQLNVGLSNMTTDEQMMMGVFSLAKVGMFLKYWMDRAGTGAPVATVDGCRNNGLNTVLPDNVPATDADDLSGIPDFYINQIASGIALLNETAAAIPGVGTTVTDITTLCTTLSGMGYSICTDYNSTTVSSNDNYGMRALIIQSDAGTVPGIGVFASGSGVASHASDPTGPANPNSGLWQCTGFAGCCP